MIQFFIDVMRLDQLRRREAQLLDIKRFCREQAETMNDEKNDGRDAVTPTGDD